MAEEALGRLSLAVQQPSSLYLLNASSTVAVGVVAAVGVATALMAAALLSAGASPPPATVNDKKRKPAPVYDDDIYDDWLYEDSNQSDVDYDAYHGVDYASSVGNQVDDADGGATNDAFARSTDQVDWDSLKVLDYLAVMEDMWRKLDIHEPACQKRVLCELHQNEHVLGPAASRIVNAFGYLRYLSLLNLPDSIKSFIDEFQEAADMGRSKAGGDQCAESYDACDFSIKETFLKFLPAPVPQSGEVHHSEGAAVPDDVDNQLHDD